MLCLSGFQLYSRWVPLKQQRKTLKNCYAEQFSKTLISIRFNLVQFCPSVAAIVSVVLF